MEDLLKKHLRSPKIVVVAFSVFLIGAIITIFQVVSLNQLVSENEDIDNIDVVYTWVNGSDEKFIQSIIKYGKDIDQERYGNNNELKYSLRSLEKFAPWLRHIYIVTNGQIPSWLNLEYEKVSIIPHHQLVREPGILPTFSSNVIEQFLHLIPNLSKRFLYLSDDIFLGAELYLKDLYTPSRGIHVYTTTDVPSCAPLCPWHLLHDEICDRECNVAECEFDGNDCNERNEDRPIPYNVMPDPYIISIINSSKMFHLTYGLKKRFLLPHTGFLFDKDIMKDMFLKFGKEFNNTRYNRFRTMHDIQTPFSYFHFVMSEKIAVPADKIFDRFDLDKSEILSDDEIRLLLKSMYSLEALTKSRLHHFEELVSNCLNSNYGMDDENVKYSLHKNLNSQKVTRNLVINCAPLNKVLVKQFSIQNKYTFEVTSQKGYLNTFILLTSDIIQATTALNNLRKKPKIFNRVGERADQTGTEEDWQEVRKALHDFYISLFPNPSEFELPEFSVNQFRYYDDYLEWKTRERLRSIFSVTNILYTLLIFFILICCLILIYPRKYYKYKYYSFYFIT